MNSSGLSDLLQAVGHRWIWHEEVFAWLFLERVFAESRGSGIDPAGFEKVYRRAQAELRRRSFHVRHIIAIEGIPQIKRSVTVGPGVSLSPIDFRTHHYELARLLQWKYQDTNRPISFWLTSGSCLLIQDRIISKVGDGSQLIDYLDCSRREEEAIVLALKLASDWYIYPKTRFTSHLSAFPLLPLSQETYQEFADISLSEQKPIKPKGLREIRSYFSFVSQYHLAPKAEPDFVVRAFSKLAGSYRVRHEEQNIVDLVVVLEALLGVREELSRRLALNSALLLGKSEFNSRDVYRKVRAAYSMRNAIVHGGQNQTKELTRALNRFDPNLKVKTDDDIARSVHTAVLEIRRLVRLILRAYIHMRKQDTRGKWPTAKEIEELQFDSNGRRSLQRQLGIRPG